MRNVMKVVKIISNSKIIATDGSGKKFTLFSELPMKVGSSILVVNGVVVRTNLKTEESTVYWV